MIGDSCLKPPMARYFTSSRAVKFQVRHDMRREAGGLDPFAYKDGYDTSGYNSYLAT